MPQQKGGKKWNSDIQVNVPCDASYIDLSTQLPEIIRYLPTIPINRLQGKMLKRRVGTAGLLAGGCQFPSPANPILEAAVEYLEK